MMNVSAQTTNKDLRPPRLIPHRIRNAEDTAGTNDLKFIIRNIKTLYWSRPCAFFNEDSAIK